MLDPTRPMKKDLPGRNDPCWCGSGKKYKKCHMAEDASASRQGSAPSGTIADALLNGGKLKKRGPGAPILSDEEKEGMRAAGRFNATLMDEVRKIVKPGVTTEEIDNLVYTYTMDHGHRPATLNYRGTYPKSCCTSINEVICHGIPDETVLKEGDIVNVDLTSIVDGWHGDQSETFLIGEVEPRIRELAQTAFECLWLGIRAVKPGARIRDIGEAICNHAEPKGFSVVDEYQGHGLGRQFHQEPAVPHVPNNQRTGMFEIAAGMCFTVEPMINLGTRRGILDHRDGWTVRTRDGLASAQFEHSLLVTDDGVDVLTLTKDGPQEGDTLQPSI